MIVYFARCPEHGLHGQRERCYECGQEAEQMPFVSLPEHVQEQHRVTVLDACVDALLEVIDQLPPAHAITFEPTVTAVRELLGK